MSGSSHSIDRLQATFDHGGMVACAGLLAPATLMARLGLGALVERWVGTGSANPGRKVLTLVAAMLAGGTCIDHVGMLRAGAAERVLGFKVAAPSTVGTFLRSFTFGHVRQLEAVASRVLARAWGLGAGPGSGPLVVDLDSTVCEVHGKQKQGAAYGHTRELGYHPLLATRAGTGEVLFARMRKGSAHTARGVLRFVSEVLAAARRAGAAGAMTVRADSGFWSWKLIDCLGAHNVRWSITVRQIPKVKAAVAAIAESHWQAIAYTAGGEAQVAETTYTAGDEREVRLVVRRTRLRGQAQRRLWPDWRHPRLHHRPRRPRHRRRGRVPPPTRHHRARHRQTPSHYGANCELAHNLSTWTARPPRRLRSGQTHPATASSRTTPARWSGLEDVAIARRDHRAMERLRDLINERVRVEGIRVVLLVV